MTGKLSTKEFKMMLKIASQIQQDDHLLGHHYDKDKEIEQLRDRLVEPEKFHNRNCACCVKHQDYPSYNSLSYKTINSNYTYKSHIKSLLKSDNILNCKCDNCLHVHYK
eukprot:98820_1